MRRSKSALEATSTTATHPSKNAHNASHSSTSTSSSKIAASTPYDFLLKSLSTSDLVVVKPTHHHTTHNDKGDGELQQSVVVDDDGDHTGMKKKMSHRRSSRSASLMQENHASSAVINNNRKQRAQSMFQTMVMHKSPSSSPSLSLQQPRTERRNSVLNLSTSQQQLQQQQTTEKNNNNDGDDDSGGSGRSRENIGVPLANRSTTAPQSNHRSHDGEQQHLSYHVPNQSSSRKNVTTTRDRDNDDIMVVDNEQEDGNTPIHIPEQYYTSPLVSHIRAMIKVLKGITKTWNDNRTVTPRMNHNNNNTHNATTITTTHDMKSPRTATPRNSVGSSASMGGSTMTSTATTATTLNQLILSMSYLRDLDLRDVRNQYAIVEAQGICPLLKLLSFQCPIMTTQDQYQQQQLQQQQLSEHDGGGGHDEESVTKKHSENTATPSSHESIMHEIRIGAASILCALSYNSRLQLRIADESGMNTLLNVLFDSEQHTNNNSDNNDMNNNVSKDANVGMSGSQSGRSRGGDRNKTIHQSHGPLRHSHYPSFKSPRRSRSGGGSGDHHHTTARNKGECLIQFQSIICQILSNCCQRVYVRRLFRHCHGISKLLSFLRRLDIWYTKMENRLSKLLSYSAPAGHRNHSNHVGHHAKSHHQHKQSHHSLHILAKQKKLSHHVKLVYHAFQLLCSVLRSQQSQELVRRLDGATLFKNYLPHMMHYHSFHHQQQQGQQQQIASSQASPTSVTCNQLNHSEPAPFQMEYPLPFITCLLACVMRCAENVKFRTEMMQHGTIDSLFKVIQILHRNGEYNYDVTFQIVVSGLINELSSDDFTCTKWKAYGVASMFDQWLKQYENELASHRTSNNWDDRKNEDEDERGLKYKQIIHLLAYMTSALWKSTRLETNANEILQLNMMSPLVNLVSIPTMPHERSYSPSNRGSVSDGRNQHVEMKCQNSQSTPTSDTTNLPYQMTMLILIMSNSNTASKSTHTATSSSVDSLEENVKVACTGIMSNCARTSTGRETMVKTGVVQTMCQLLTMSASTKLIVNCLDTLGHIASDSPNILSLVLEHNGMKSIWTMLRSENALVQAAAARAICNCINDSRVAEQIGQIFISGMAVLVRMLEQSKDPFVIGYCCQAITKIGVYETNRAVLTEEGALLQLSRVLQATRHQFDEIIQQMGQSHERLLTSRNHRNHRYQLDISSSMKAQTVGDKTHPKDIVYTIDHIRELNLVNNSLNKRLNDVLFVKSHVSTAIGELAKRKGNRIKLYEYGAVEPLVENLMLHPFLQAHFKANNENQSVENFTMIEIVGSKNKSHKGSGVTGHQNGRAVCGVGISTNSSHVYGQEMTEMVTNPSLTCTTPFTCDSVVCVKNAGRSIESSTQRNSSSGKKCQPIVLVRADLDCHYSHVFRNTSYALSILSEEETIAVALRNCNCVALLTKLLSSRNDDLQIAAATCASNIRQYHVSRKKLSGSASLLAPPTIRPSSSPPKSRSSFVAPP